MHFLTFLFGLVLYISFCNGIHSHCASASSQVSSSCAQIVVEDQNTTNSSLGCDTCLDSKCFKQASFERPLFPEEYCVTLERCINGVSIYQECRMAVLMVPSHQQEICFLLPEVWGSLGESCHGVCRDRSLLQHGSPSRPIPFIRQFAVAILSKSWCQRQGQGQIPKPAPEAAQTTQTQRIQYQYSCAAATSDWSTCKDPVLLQSRMLEK